MDKELQLQLLKVVLRYKTSCEQMFEDKIMTSKQYYKIIKKVDNRIKELTE